MNVNNVMALAESLHVRSDKRFSMRNWCDCIHGFARELWPEAESPNLIAKQLGISHAQEDQLTLPCYSSAACDLTQTREDAIETLHRLAATGQVLWPDQVVR